MNPDLMIVLSYQQNLPKSPMCYNRNRQNQLMFSIETTHHEENKAKLVIEQEKNQQTVKNIELFELALERTRKIASQRQPGEKRMGDEKRIG